MELDGDPAGDGPRPRHARYALTHATRRIRHRRDPDARSPPDRGAGAPPLTIDPATDNEAAIRAYERVGFRKVGVMRSYELGPDGTWHDGLLMELLAGELRN